MSVISINNAQELAARLAAEGIDLQTWGRAHAKTVEHLHRELKEKDCQLYENPFRRRVNVIEVLIRRGDTTLMEAEQELADGRSRIRNLPPSEKMKAGEDVETAALRCLWEELGVEETAVTLLLQTHTQKQKELTSPSYPGLLSVYTIHAIEAIAPELPDGNFWRDNGSFADGDPVKRHRWAWQNQD